MNKESDESQKKHYDKYAHEISKRDIYLSSRIARKEITLNAINPIIIQKKTLGVVVDIGCGIGNSAIYLNGLYDKYIGIDISKGMIDIGRDFTRNIKNVEFIVANIKDESLPENIADTIIMDGALHHMTGLDDVIQSIKKLAKPDAYFVAREPQRGNPVIQLLRHIRMMVDKSYSRDQKFFTGEEIQQLLIRNNLKNVSISYQGFVTPIFAQIVLRPQLVFGFLSKMTIHIEKILQKIMIGPMKKLSWNIVVYGIF